MANQKTSLSPGRERERERERVMRRLKEFLLHFLSISLLFAVASCRGTGVVAFDSGGEGSG
jgi:hypothetical protein